MKIGSLIKEERKRRNITQEKLANMIGLSRRTIIKYEKGYPIPYDILLRMIEELRSPRLRLQALGGAIPCIYLDQVDLSPLATQQKAIEEMQEALDELKELKLVNKNNPDDLTKKERKKLLERTMLELQDVNICMDLILVSLSETFNIDLNELEKISREKMVNSGYQSTEEERMAVAK